MLAFAEAILKSSFQSLGLSTLPTRKPCGENPEERREENRCSFMKVKIPEESLGLYDLECYSAISLSSIAQLKRRWLFGYAAQVRVPLIVVCHLWKNLTSSNILKVKLFINAGVIK